MSAAGELRSPGQPRRLSLHVWSEWTDKLLLPEPWVFLPGGYYASADWVLQHILNFRIEVLGGSRDVIEGLCLPNFPLAAQGLVDAVRGGAFDGIHDLGERIDLSCGLIDERREDQVNMVGHDDGDLEIELCAIVMQAGFENDRADVFGQGPAVLCAERHEVRFVVAL